MGRKTFESIGEPLPNRNNIIITRDNNYSHDGCIVHNSIENGIKFAESNGESELFVIGGGEIYKYCLECDLIDQIYLTRVNFDGEADTFFPELDMQEWGVEESTNYHKDNHNEFDFKIEILRKILILI
jgi:dihydrofolate reductase